MVLRFRGRRLGRAREGSCIKLGSSTDLRLKLQDNGVHPDERFARYAWREPTASFPCYAFHLMQTPSTGPAARHNEPEWSVATERFYIVNRRHGKPMRSAENDFICMHHYLR